MSGIRLTGGQETAKALNDLARHQIITRLYTDILADMMVCDVEGWNKTEFIRILQDVINHFEIKEGDKANNGMEKDRPQRQG